MIVQNKNLSLFLAWFLRLWFENVEYHCWEDQLNEKEIESITYPVSVDDEKDIEIGGEEAKAALEQYKENQRKKGTFESPIGVCADVGSNRTRSGFCERKSLDEEGSDYSGMYSEGEGGPNSISDEEDGEYIVYFKRFEVYLTNT